MPPHEYYMKYTLLIVFAVFLAACRDMMPTGADLDSPDLGEDFMRALAPTVPEEPRNNRDRFIALALTRAVIEEKDIPDYQLLRNKSRIILSNTTDEGELIEPSALPASDSVRFILLGEEAIQQYADTWGDFLYLCVNQAFVGADTARVDVSTRWAIDTSDRRNESEWPLSGGGYRLEWIRQDSTWTIPEIKMIWMS